ncbi:MAG TPA: LysM peptidoglycan-binding domain-containing protein [Bacteroidales bacterium]|nr:LysM peptidoglycan-binding domain-containing protein [Bacteroidales bacterium]
MRIIRQVKIVLFILLINLGSAAFGQVVVERSQNKAVISGVAYYIHLVKKGETAYSISKAYGIKVEELVKENPPALYGLTEGQTLRIPVSSVTEADAKPVPEPVKRKRDEINFIYHTLNPGETIYYLSKLYGVSDNEIIQSNQGLDINKLSVGTEIAIPRRKFMSDRQKFDIPDKNYVYHKVQEGESLGSIAQIYGLSVKELRRENRDLRFPQVGDYVRVPVAREAEIQAAVAEEKDSVPVALAEVLKPVERPAGYTKVKELSGSIDVAVLLPFYFSENARRIEVDSSRMIKGKRIYKDTKRPDEWIYPGSIDFVEMYEGILLAADTLRSLGMDINLSTYDIKSDTIELERLINSGKLADMDLIIGPVYSRNLTKVSAYAREAGIPVVSPVPFYNNSVLEGNPNLFMANPSLEVSQKALARKLSEYVDHNFIFIHSDSLGVDADVKRFKNMIITELTAWMPFEDIKFKELLFFSRSKFDNDSINRLEHALSSQAKNIIIIASEDPPVISETIMDVHGLLKKHNLKIFGYPILREIETLEPRYFFDLDMLVFSPFWIDYNSNDIKQFNADFRRKFMTEPTEISYAWQGYDIAYYFISGLALHGKEFINNPLMHRVDLLHTDFDFENKNINDGFENKKLYLIHFSKDFNVTLAEDNNDMP